MDNRRTPLLMAVYKEKVTTVEYLLSQGALQELKFGIGIRNWNSELEFGIGIRNWNSELEFRIGISPQVGVLK